MRKLAGALCIAALVLPGCGEEPAAPRKPIRGVILFVGDGMGVATVTAARIHRGALEGLAVPASASLAVDEAPRGALLHTWSSDNMVTDSAAGITALVAGEKVPNGAIAARKDGETTQAIQTVFEIAEAHGWSTGVVSTTRLTHATPAGCFAHNINRREEQRIAESLVPGGNRRLGDGLEVVLGGGREWLVPYRDGGERTDERNLLVEMQEKGYRLVETAAEMKAAVTEGADRLLGVFSDSHMAYEADRAGTDEPSLADMTRAALAVLEKDPEGFLLMVEGGRIDHALHGNNGYRAVTDMLAFDDAIRAAVTSLDPEETLILVTSDHDHTMVLAGYPPASADVFTRAGVDENGVPYTALLFANGPSAENAPPDSLDLEHGPDPDFMERAGVPLSSETHGGMDVPLYAFGPERCLDPIRASMNNTEVFGILRDAVEGK